MSRIQPYSKPPIANKTDRTVVSFYLDALLSMCAAQVLTEVEASLLMDRVGDWAERHRESAQPDAAQIPCKPTLTYPPGVRRAGSDNSTFGDHYASPSIASTSSDSDAACASASVGYSSGGCSASVDCSGG